MNRIELNDLFFNARFSEPIEVGLIKDDVEHILGRTLGDPDIETPDVSSYYVELKSGLIISLLFDKSNICYEINLDLDENKEINFFIQLGLIQEEINENTSFEQLIAVLYNLNIGWKFDRNRIYLQTICILLDSGLRLYYAFGNKKENDYGLFSIKLILGNHELATPGG